MLSPYKASHPTPPTSCQCPDSLFVMTASKQGGFPEVIQTEVTQITSDTSHKKLRLKRHPTPWGPSASSQQTPYIRTNYLVLSAAKALTPIRLNAWGKNSMKHIQDLHKRSTQLHPRMFLSTGCTFLTQLFHFTGKTVTSFLISSAYMHLPFITQLRERKHGRKWDPLSPPFLSLAHGSPPFPSLFSYFPLNHLHHPSCSSAMNPGGNNLPHRWHS